jgi:hypothetical protein
MLLPINPSILFFLYSGNEDSNPECPHDCTGSILREKIL